MPGAKSQPPAPGERIHLGLIQHAAPIGAFQSPPVLAGTNQKASWYA
jgi:hypothetical protein